jgi:hypothetical protein
MYTTNYCNEELDITKWPNASYDPLSFTFVTYKSFKFFNVTIGPLCY